MWKPTQRIEVYGIEDDVVVGVLELNVENGERETFFSYDASNVFLKRKESETYLGAIDCQVRHKNNMRYDSVIA